MAFFDTEHKTAPLGKRHPTHDLEFATAADRLALAYAVEDIGKDYRDLDTGKFYKLISVSSGVGTFLELGGSGGTGGSSGSGGGVATVTLPFSFGDATPEVIGTLVSGDTLVSVSLSILTSFNGTGGGLSIGTDTVNNKYMSLTDNDPYSVGYYETHPAVKLTAAETLKLFITPGSGITTGSGLVILTTKT